MDCRKVESRLDLYVERELEEKEAAEIREHLQVCPLCQRKLGNLQQMTDLLYQFPSKEPTPNLARNIVAVVEARAAAAQIRQRWLRTATASLGAAFATLLVLWSGYETFIALQEGGGMEFISLVGAHPHLLFRYPTDALYAVLEALPLVNIVLTLGASLVAWLLAGQFVNTLSSRQVNHRLNGGY